MYVCGEGEGELENECTGLNELIMEEIVIFFCFSYSESDIKVY
jgi:hypothetical protein